MIAQIIGYAQMAGFGLMFFGKNLFELMGQPAPSWVQYMNENKLNTFSMLFVASFFSTQLHATGAFEVYFNGQTLHSKLANGRIPDISVILRGLEQAGMSKAMETSQY